MSSQKNTPLDLWGLIASDNKEISNEDPNDTTIVVVGDFGSGKSSLLQSFLKPTISKEPKPTVALEYSFARKKASSSSSNVSKLVANIWELGGDINEPKLLDFPITSKTLPECNICICLDLSKPKNVVHSLMHWISVVRDAISKRMQELQTINPSTAQALKETAARPYKEPHVDAGKVKPCELPLFIFANKYDTVKALPTADRRSLFQLMRFIAHYHGATLLVTSIHETTLKESFRNIFNSIAFRSILKPMHEISIDKSIFVSPGQDSFESIGQASNSKSKSDANYEKFFDFEQCLDSSGVVKKDSWAKMREFSVVLFGQPDPGSEFSRASNNNDIDPEQENEYPEAEVDAMKVQRDIAIDRYVQEIARREATLSKMQMHSKDDHASLGAEIDDKIEEKKISKSSSSRKSKK